ncbi:MAG: FecR domain-containing protein [Bacteroidota bacterium]
MNKDKNSRQDAGRIAKYLSGEMTGAESAAFEAGMAASGEEHDRMEELKKQWSALEGYQEATSPDTRQAWDKLHGRLQDEQLIPAYQQEVKSLFLPALLKIAALLLLLLTSAAVTYVIMHRKPAVEMVRVDTGAGDRTLVKTLADGSVIYLAHHSSFSFPQLFGSQSRHVALQGEAFFDVASNPAHPFVIETDRALIEVLGTAFNVKNQQDDGFELSVERGKVKVTLKSDPSHCQLVLAGEKVSAVRNSLVKSKHVPGEAWYKERMQFKDEPLRHILDVLNRNFNTNFAVAGAATGNHKLTVMFDHETAATMTELICMTLNLKSQTIHGAVVFSENREGAKPN